MNIWLFNSLNVKKFIPIFFNKLPYYSINPRVDHLLPGTGIAVQASVFSQKNG
jgi:hypothetical protein